MNNLDHAINEFRASANDLNFHAEDRERCTVLADALDYIKTELELHVQTLDRLTHPEHSAPQPATFEPWHDVVEIIGPDDNGSTRYIGFEGFVIGIDALEYKDYEVRLSDEHHPAYFPASSLRLVYRLKPRAQAEPRFKCRDLVRNIFDIEEYSYEVMQDTNGPRVQLRDCKTGQPRAFVADDLRKIDKSAPFQVGDWVEGLGVQFKVARMDSKRAYGWDGQEIDIALLHKIDLPAPRFTFGDRVRWIDEPQAEGLITSDHGNGYYDVAFKDGTHPDPMDVIHGSKLTLDTAAD